MKTSDEQSNQKLKVSGKSDAWDDELAQTPGDALLFARISDYFMGHTDIEEVKNDPSRDEACEMAAPIDGHRCAGDGT